MGVIFAPLNDLYASPSGLAVRLRCNPKSGEEDESAGISEARVPQLQSDPP